ncbi:MAG: response regulator transcription factor [Ancalomicrobiaceae bacterium]|nr:response regulator transcription factor [Ancalomicrobiaceae bacterium]
MTQRLLIIDDDRKLAGMLADYLANAAYVVEIAGTAKAGLDAIAHASQAGAGFDLVILDLMLPDLDGFEVCRRLRIISDLPVIMLTARGEETDRIVGLEMGADDYLPKPFNPRELLARLKAVLRRGRGSPAEETQPPLRFGRLEIDPGSRVVKVQGEPRIMTSYQFDLLLALASHPGRVLTREQIMDFVKGEELDAFDRSIDVHISRIRAAIEDDPKHPRRIITVRGAGYVFARLQDEV